MTSHTPAPKAHISLSCDAPSFSAVGDIYTIRASGAQTGGTLTLLESRIPPGGGPPPHVHSREDESFYVLSGTITFFTKDGPVRAGPGAFVHLPRTGPHTFKNEGTSEARMLIWCSPAGFDSMIRQIGTPVPSHDSAPIPPTPDDIARVLSICPTYGITIPVAL